MEGCLPREVMKRAKLRGEMLRNLRETILRLIMSGYELGFSNFTNWISDHGILEVMTRNLQATHSSYIAG